MHESISFNRALMMPGISGVAPRRTRPWLLLVACCLTLAAPSGRAMSVSPPTFDELVAESTQVFRVEIVATEARLETGADGPVIHTYVRCRPLRLLKGTPAEGEFTLVFQGGDVGDLHMVVPGMPRYVAGERCIFFVERGSSRFCPLVAVQHGSYRIVSDGSVERVLRDNREPLTNTAEVRLPVHGIGALQMPVAGALTLATFERLITDKVAEQAAHASAP